MPCHTVRGYLSEDLNVILNFVGMILFPLGEEAFQATGPDGIAMFYVSCIVSQLVFSCGGTIFKGGVGSEMVSLSLRYCLLLAEYL